MADLFKKKSEVLCLEGVIGDEVRLHISNDCTGQNENFRENGALRAGGNEAESNAGETNRKFKENPVD